jgi:BolA protein
MDMIMTVKELIENKLDNEFSPISLEIIDESSKHEGHAGSRPEGETHFAISLVSEKFTGLNRLAKQRLVFAALKDELETHIHALRFIKLEAPSS